MNMICTLACFLFQGAQEPAPGPEKPAEAGTVFTSLVKQVSIDGQSFADEFAFKNGRDAAIYLKVVPVAGFSVHADFHNFWLARDKDGWYNSAGAQIRRDATGAATDRVGQEIDIHARLVMGKYVKLWVGGSHFFTGPYVRQTPGQDQDMNWFFAQMTVDF